MLDDLAARGLLDETLVVWLGELGRTPKINRVAGPPFVWLPATQYGRIGGMAGNGPGFLGVRIICSAFS